MSAAVTALPSDHPAVTRIQFLYGGASPYQCGATLQALEDRPLCAYVVFTFDDRSRHYVPLKELHGNLSVGRLANY